MSEPAEKNESGVPGRPVSGRWFEDLPEGLVVRHAVTRTITEADNTSTASSPSACWLASPSTS